VLLFGAMTKNANLHHGGWLGKGMLGFLVANRLKNDMLRRGIEEH
jgi:hypothetical protein